MQFDRVISMMRYMPANGTAGLARSRVRGKSRSPAPPASSTPSVSFIPPLRSPCALAQLSLNARVARCCQLYTDNRNVLSSSAFTLLNRDAQGAQKVYILGVKSLVPIRAFGVLELGDRLLSDFVQPNRRFQHKQQVKALLADA